MILYICNIKISLTLVSMMNILKGLLKMKIGKYITLKHEELVKDSTGMNGVNISETRQLRPFEAAIVAENNQVCDIKGVRNKHTLDINVNFFDKKYVVKFFQPNDTISGISDVAKIIGDAIKNKSAIKGLEKIMLPKIYDENDQVIGTFENYFVDMENVRQNYNAIKMTYNNVEYFIYQVKSHFIENYAWSVYENNSKLITEIVVDRHRGLSSNRDLMKYDIYVDDDKYFDLACILTVVWMKMTGPEEKQNSKMPATLKDLQAKYSAEFIDNIRNNINPSFLPEKMSLVEELYKKGKYELHRVIGRLFVLIPLILLIILIIYILVFAK